MIRAINKTVVLKALRTTHKTKGFEVQDNLDMVRFHYGGVIASSELNEVKVGDKVYYDGAAGSPLIHDGETYLVMDENHIKIIDDD